LYRISNDDDDDNDDNMSDMSQSVVYMYMYILIYITGDFADSSLEDNSGSLQPRQPAVIRTCVLGLSDTVVTGVTLIDMLSP
jgi:hypothetical protein